MRKIKKLILSSIIFLTVLLPAYIAADSYRVISIQGCNATLNDTIVREGAVIPKNSRIKIKKIDNSSSWVIKLQSTSTGKIHPLCSPSPAACNSNSESWLSWFWNSIIGQKKCSTRAPENELTYGLANNLSQTYYLCYPYNYDSNSNIDFVTNLENGTYLKCSYYWEQQLHSFEIPISNGMFSLSSKYFDITPANERTILQLDVKYISGKGETIPITNSMNVIIINEEF